MNIEKNVVKRLIYFLMVIALLFGFNVKIYADARYGGISTRCLVKTNAEDYMYAGVEIKGGEQCTEVQGLGIAEAEIVGNNFKPALSLQTFPDGIYFQAVNDIYQATNTEG